MTENHFRSHFSPFQINTQLFFKTFFLKWPLAAILEVRFGALWMTENHFRTHFSQFQIIFVKIAAILEARFAPKTIGFFHYVLSMAMPNMKLIGDFYDKVDRKSVLIAFLTISDQYITFVFQNGRHFGSPICAKNNRVLPLCVINGYDKYEVDR